MIRHWATSARLDRHLIHCFANGHAQAWRIHSDDRLLPIRRALVAELPFETNAGQIPVLAVLIPTVSLGRQWVFRTRRLSCALKRYLGVQ